MKLKLSPAHHSFLQFASLLLLSGALCLKAVAANETWTGAAGDNNWNTGGNWTGPNTPPAAGDIITFGTQGAGGLTLNNNMTVDTAFQGLYFNATAPSFVLTGNEITTTGATIDNSLNFETINQPITSTATHTYGVASGGTMLFGGVLSGTGAGITKTLGGTLTLTNINSYTGGTTINAGTLTLDFTGGAANNIAPDTALTLGGGTLVINGGSGATDSQAFTGTTLSPGQNIITAINGASGGTATVTLGGLTVNPGASVIFYGPASATGGVAATGKITTSTAGTGATTAGQDGILAAGAENNTYATVGLYDWATTDSGATTAGTTVIGGSSISGFYIVPVNNTIPSGTPNWDIANQETVAFSAGTTARIGNSGGVVESLRFNTGIAPYIDVKGGFTLISGGLLVTPNMGQINVGVCELNLVNTTCQIVQNNTTALLIIGISSTATSVWQAFTGSAANTADNVVKSGAGTLFLNPIAGAGLPINYTNGSGVYTLSTSGRVTAGYYDSTNAANSTSAAFYLNGGVTVINNGNQLGNPTTQGTTAGAMGTVNLNGGTLMGAQRSFSLVNAAAASAARPVFLGGNGGGLAAQTTNTFTIPGVISGATGTGPLTIGIPASSANGNNVGLVPGTGSAGSYVTKNPAFNANGTVLLTASNTYIGNTIISSGTLQLGATGSINNSSNIIVGAGATYDVSLVSGYTLAAGVNLMGSGTVTGLVSAVSGSGIYGGTDGTYGTNTFVNNLTLASGAAAYFDLGISAIGSNDMIVVNGTLTLNGNTIHVKAPSPTAVLAPANYILFSNANPIVGNTVLTLAWDVPPANSGKYSIAVVGNNVMLQYATGVGPIIAATTDSPNPVYPNETVLVSATVLPDGSNAISSVTADVSQIAGTGQPGSGATTKTLYLSATPNVYTNSVNVGASVPIGSVTNIVIAVDTVADTSYATNTLSIISGAPAILVSASPNPVGPGQKITISATVLGDSYPIIAGGVKVDVSAIAGTSPGTTILTLYLSSSPNVYTNSYTVLNTTGYGAQPLTVSAVNSGTETNTATLALTVGPLDVWTGLGADNNWITGNNWISGITPNTGDFVTFAGNHQPTTDMNNNYSIGSLTFDQTAGAFNITDPTASYTLTLTGGLTNNSANVQTLSVPVALGGTQTFNVMSNSIVIANNLVDDTSDGLVGGIVMAGTNSLTLGGANNYSGGTTVNGGVLSISADANVGAVPGSPVTNVVLNGGDLLGNGTLVLNANRGIGIGLTNGGAGATALIDAASGQTFELDGVIASAGNAGTENLTVNSIAPTPGTVVLGGANTFNGTTVISNGTLQLNNALALQGSALNYNSGALLFGNGITAATLAGLAGTNSAQNLVLNNGSSGVALTVGGNNASTIYSGGLTDAGLSGSLIKAGAGTLTLTANNSFGAATVNAGSLVMNGTNILSGATTINSGGNSMLTASGGLLAGTTLTMNSANSSLGFLLSGGTASFSGNVAFSADNGNNANFLQITNGVFNAGSLNSGRCNLNLGIATQPTAGQSTGQGIYVSGTATVNITNTLGIGGSSAAANSSASMRVDNGTVNVGGTTMITLNNATRWSVLDVNGGTFTSTNATGAGIQIGGGYAGASAIMLVRAGTVSADKITFGDGTQTTGTNVLSQTGGTLYVGSGGIVSGNASPAYTNKITLGAGIVGATGNWSSSLPMTLSGNTTFQAADASSNAWNIELDGVLSGTGALNKTGNGTLTLTGADNYAGGTTNNGGTLRVNGSIASSVTVNNGATNGGSGMISGNVTVNGGGHTLPGGSLTTTIGGNLTYNTGAEADFSLSSTYNSGNDQIVVSNGVVTANGVNIGINNAGSLDTTGNYVLMTNLTGAIVGSFARTPVWLGTTPANAANYSIVTLSNNVLLQFSPIVFSSTSATPNPAIHGQLVTISVSATSTGNTITGVSLNAGAIGGAAALTLKQVGATGVYTNSVIVSSATPTGVQSLAVTAVDSGSNTNTVTFSLTIIGSDEVWDGNGQPNNMWADGANWVSGVVPGPGDWATFAGTKELTANMESSYSLSSLTFDVTAGAFTITNAANTLTLTGGVTNNSANVQTLSVPMVLSGTLTFNAASNSIVMSTNVSGTGGLIVAGTNALTLAGSNTYSGVTTVGTNAILQLANANAVKGSALTLNNGSTLQLRADSNNTFAPASLSLQNASDNLAFDAGPVTTGVTGGQLILNGTLAFGNASDQTINVTGNSTYALSLGAITLNTGSHTPFFNLNVNTLPGGPSVMISSVTVGNWGNDVNMNGGGKVTVTGNLSNTSNGSLNLFVNNRTTVTLQGASIKANTADAFKYDVANGTLVLDNSAALTNITSGAGLTQGLFILGAATNLLFGTGYTHEFGVLTTNNNSYNAAVYLGDANNASGGLSTAANLTNNVSDGDVTFTNSGVFTIGGQNTSGTNIYANPIILGWTANRGKSVTLVAAGGGEVDFTGGIRANGTDPTAGITVGDAAHGGTVKVRGTANTYAGPTTVSNGTLLVSGTLANGAVTVDGGTLGGSGTLGGAVTVQAGGTIQPGAGAGAAGSVLTINNSLTLNSGSATLLAVSHNNHTNDQISYQAIVYGGTLTVTTNAGDGPLVAGDTFQLFKASLSFYSGSFSATNLPALGAGLGWSNSFAANGSITVVASAASGAPVTISGGAISGGMFVISGTNGVPGAQYRILETTNAALAITNWTPVWTNVFGAGGSFSYTNTPGVNPAGFFLLVSP